MVEIIGTFAKQTGMMLDVGMIGEVLVIE